jgi:hypothetical protein
VLVAGLSHLKGVADRALDLLGKLLEVAMAMSHPSKLFEFRRAVHNQLCHI